MSDLHSSYIPGGAVELCDVGVQLTGLKYCKGTYSWKVSREIFSKLV